MEEAFKKNCPVCGAFTYHLNRNIKKCASCGADISDIEAISAGHTEKPGDKNSPDFLNN